MNPIEHMVQQMLAAKPEADQEPGPNRYALADDDLGLRVLSCIKQHSTPVKGVTVRFLAGLLNEDSQELSKAIQRLRLHNYIFSREAELGVGKLWIAR